MDSQNQDAYAGATMYRGISWFVLPFLHYNFGREFMSFRWVFGYAGLSKTIRILFDFPYLERHLMLCALLAFIHALYSKVIRERITKTVIHTGDIGTSFLLKPLGKLVKQYYIWQFIEPVIILTIGFLPTALNPSGER